MAPLVDGGLVLYAVGVLLGVAALAYFSRNLLRSLSITVKAALLLEAAVAFVAVGSFADRAFLDAAAYGLAGGAYVVFLWYWISNYDVGEAGVFAALAASSGLFVAGGYLLRSGSPGLSGSTAGAVLAVLAVVAVALVIADRRTGEVETAVDFASTVTLDEGRVTVGTATLTNPSPFRRRASPSSPTAHLSADDQRVVRPLDVVAVEDGPRPGRTTLSGHETVARDLVLPLGALAGPDGPVHGRTVRIERVDEPPESVDDDVLAVVA